MSNTRALIDAIISGSAVETEEAFNATMAEKISTRLDDMRMEVAANMFKSEQVEQVQEEAEQIDEYNLGSGSKKTSLIGRATSGSRDRTEIPDSVRKQGEEINKIFAQKDEKKKG